MSLYHSRIASSGSYLPQRVMTNSELEQMVETSDEWIVARTGIRERRIAAENEMTSDLALKAALNAIDAANIDAQDIDLIVVATTTPDLVFPSTACLVQERLGIRGCPAFDVQAVCAGFIYAIDIADKFIKTGTATKALVIGAETFSRIIDWQDRNTCILFGDGAGAVILERSSEPGVVSSILHADGRYADLLCVPVGVSSNYQKVVQGEAYTTMQGSEVFKVAVKKLGESIDEIIVQNQLVYDDIDWMVPHQANIRIISAMAKKLKLPMERVIVTVDTHGNTSAASIPLALDTGIRDGRIKRGQKLILEGFGGGFAWGGTLINY